MYPTLNSNIYNEYGLQVEGYADSVYINRFAGYKRGDIVVFKDPDPNRSTGIYVVKRLIAMEGDKIAIGTNYESEYENVYKIFLIENGSSSIKILEENYLPTATSLYETSKDFENYRLANPTKFSTEISPVYGTLYFLTLSENEAFILGDNRSAGSSNDSADYGAVSSTKYIGRVDIIAYQSQNNFSYIFLYYWRKIFG
jgi:signal peptidase I